MKKTVIEIKDGVAFYKKGSGPSVFLMPYPHASTYRPVAESRLSELLVNNGFTILSFDPPGSFKSTRKPELSIDEMISCTINCLDHFKINIAIPVLGHSMGSLMAMAYTVSFKKRVSKLILVGGTSGWKMIRKYGVHKSFHPLQKEFWVSRYLGSRIIMNLNNLRIHKKLDNLNAKQSFHNTNYYEKLIINPGDHKKPPPPRSKWLRMIRNYDISSKLNELELPVLLITGVYDKITPLVMARELENEITASKLIIFNDSGHSPFIEESALFLEEIKNFLGEK